MDIKRHISSVTTGILVPVVILSLIFGWGLYYFNLRFLSDFVRDRIKAELQSHSRHIYNLCDREFTKLIHEGLVEQTKERLIQASVIEEIVSYGQRNGLVIILTDRDKQELISSNVLNRDVFYEALHKKGATEVETINIKGKNYFANHFEFQPWQWHFDIAIEEGVFSSLRKRVTEIYLLTAFFALTALIVLFYIIHRVVIKPLRAIETDIKDKKRPHYRGISEFEFLSKTISDMMDSIEYNEQFLREITSGLGEGLIVQDTHGRLTYMNPTAERLLQWEFGDLQGKRVHDYTHYHPEYPEFFYKAEECPIIKVASTGVPYNTEDDYFVRKDGSLLSVAYIASPLRRGGEIIGIVISFRDISERKQAEEERQSLQNQLHHSQKMEAIGLLAGGVAHDFNNMLTAIMGYTELIKAQIPESSPMSRFLDNILASAEKASNLTRQLLTFSRKQPPVLTMIDLNQQVSALVPLLKRLIGEDIEVKTILTKECLTVMADGGQIDQVIINLATNARDAMPKGGTLTIETSSFYVDEAYAKKRMLKNTGLYAVISVSDTGIGIPKDTLSNIFDPFFTTKKAGKGTGLGLSIVYGIAKGHNGDVRVYSEPDKGTVFKIYLPMVTKALEQPDVCQAKTYRIEGNETILYAEDEEDVREIIKIGLESAGYKVIEAVNGEDAVKKAKAYEGKIDLFLTDVIMPKMNGKEAYLSIKSFLPDIKVMFMSGYTADIIDRGLDRSPEGTEAIQVLSKPISPRDLLLKVRECLDKPCGTVC